MGYFHKGLLIKEKFIFEIKTTKQFNALCIKHPESKFKLSEYDLNRKERTMMSDYLLMVKPFDAKWNREALRKEIEGFLVIGVYKHRKWKESQKNVA